uniref:2-Cys peroxiredoxin n=1 Tax=Psammoneis obaidii TaxID=1706219 RepID=A0A2U9NRH8_9STRA|nr:2-Cys peroxiredoxin [Psammoneis obaidii]AWT39740.1 2-Cys peroxiredoxin [Psammoneis obaidii]
MINFPQIGKMAPNFLTLGVYKKRLGKIRLSDYHGKKYVILIFYPANFTSISPTELNKLSDRISEFKKLSTQILAISSDSPFSHLHYLLLKRNQGGLNHLNYPLISDSTKTITHTYNLLTDDGLSFPGLFILDKEGIIQYYTVNNLLCGRSVNELIRILQSIQYVKENPGQACPVDWKLGEQTLNSHPLKSKYYFKNLYSQKNN